MSQYTTELRHLEDQGFDFGLDKYPIFDENYRETLNRKILDHYRYREIGFETPQRFKHYLVTKMGEIMPYYNQMYESQAIKINPLSKYMFEETLTRETDGVSDNTIDATENRTGENQRERTQTDTENRQGTNTQTQDLFNVESDTPAGFLSVDDIKSNTWASKAGRSENEVTDENTEEKTGSLSETDTVTTDDKTTTKTTGASTITTTEDYIKHITSSFQGKTDAMLLVEYRETFLNIDLMIINELKTLFMGVY